MQTLIVVLLIALYVIAGIGFHKIMRKVDNSHYIPNVFFWPIGLIVSAFIED